MNPCIVTITFGVSDPNENGKASDVRDDNVKTVTRSDSVTHIDEDRIWHGRRTGVRCGQDCASASAPSGHQDHATSRTGHQTLQPARPARSHAPCHQFCAVTVNTQRLANLNKRIRSLYTLINTEQFGPGYTELCESVSGLLSLASVQVVR